MKMAPGQAAADSASEQFPCLFSDTKIASVDETAPVENPQLQPLGYLAFSWAPGAPYAPMP